MSGAPAAPRLGCDTEESRRFRDLLARRPGFLDRWFTQGERRWITGQGIQDLFAEESGLDPAARACLLFCAKEAMIKACWGEEHLLPSQVEVFAFHEVAPGAWTASARGLGAQPLKAPVDIESCEEGFLAWCIRD